MCQIFEPAFQYIKSVIDNKMTMQTVQMNLLGKKISLLPKLTYVYVLQSKIHKQLICF